MALFVRPELSVVAPPTIVAGTSASLAVVVDCSEPVEVSSIDVSLTGFQRYRYDPALRRASDLVSRWFQPESFWVAKARLDVGGRLEVGRHEWTVTFAVPEGAPSSYVGEPWQISYRAEARARVVGWLDARTSAWLAVLGRPKRVLDDRIAFATRDGGPIGRRPYFEVAMTRRLIEPGGTTEAVVSLANVADNRYRGLLARLMAVEGLKQPFNRLVERDREVLRWTVAPPGDAFAEDTPVRFRLQMPSNVVPGFDTEYASLRWFLEVRADVALGADPRVWIPIDFGQAQPTEDGREPAPAPVGAHRIALLWRRFAQRSGMSFDGRRLVGNVAGWRLEVWRTDAPTRGAGLELELRTSSLGIGLTFDGAWSARDREHARAVAAVPSPGIGDPWSADDCAIRWFVDQPGLNHERLASVVRDVCLTAGALREAVDGLDVPAALRPWSVPIERLAARFEGEIVRRSCTLLGRRDEVGLRIAPVWEGSPDEPTFGVEIELPTPMSRDVQSRWVAGLEGADRSLFGPLAARIRSVTVEGRTIRCVMARAWDPGRVVDDVEQLFALAKAAMTGTGPYR